MPILVDSDRGRDWRDYEGRTLIKANRTEAAEALGSDAGPAAMARRLVARHSCTVVVTAGELGLWWSDGELARRASAVPVEVRDASGAGDAVLAAMGVAITCGETTDEGCREAEEVVAKRLAA